MFNTDYLDIIAGSSLLLFTGAEVAATDTALELISKFGIVAVLWYWLKDMKVRLKDLMKNHDDEAKDLREHYEKNLLVLKEEQKDYRDRLDKQLDQRIKEIEDLNKRLHELTVSKKS